MAVEIILPRVDMDMEAGKVTQWFVGEGESVAKGQPLFEIETAKAAMEIEAPASGVVRGVTAKPGDELPVGAVVGWIYPEGEVYVAAPVAKEPAPAVVEKVAETAPEPMDASAPVTHGAGAGRATPKARRLAHENGIELNAIEGSGPHGRVQARDIEAKAAPAAMLGAGDGLLHREWLARGEGAPLVFVHGFGADLNSWRPLFGHLGSDRPALALDLPGHGQSPLAGDVLLDAFAETLGATLAHEGIRSAHLVAHSLGGAVAVAFAARGANVRSLTLLAPGGLGPDINGAFIDGFLRARSEASLAPWLRLLAVNEAALGGTMAKSTLRQRRDANVGASQARIAEALFPDGVQAVDVRERLAKFAGPVKVVFGLEDRIIPARHARSLPGAVAVHLFKDVGHMPHFEARGEVARLVEDNVAAGERRA